jgi:hypothetical protein
LKKVYVPFILVAFGVFISSWLVLTLSNYSLNIFDGAIDILPHYYISNGFIPYNEFGVVYPPGKFLLIGKLIPFVSVFQRDIIFSFLFLLEYIFGIYLIWKLCKNKLQFTTVFAAYLFLGTIILQVSPGNILSEISTLILILLISRYLCFESQSSSKADFSLFLTAAITAFIFLFRWNGVMILFAVLLVCLFMVSFYQKLFKKDVLDLQYLLKITLAVLFGLILGFVILIFYLYKINAIKFGLDFIFNIPVKVIMPFRVLPLPHFTSIFDPQCLIYSCLFVIIVHAILLLKHLYSAKNKNILLVWFLILIPIYALPYALGRSDSEHFTSLLIVTFMSVVISYAVNLTKIRYLILLVLLVLPVAKNTFYKIEILPTSGNNINASIDLANSDCKKHLAIVKNYNSLFVGRVSYQTYIYSAVSLYLINPNVMPATSFISDEPGLQNSCKYGDIIAKQLSKAKKPMLAFLETSAQKPEANKTAVMFSCMKIENFLIHHAYTKIGNCNVYGQTFEIRLYQ